MIPRSVLTKVLEDIDSRHERVQGLTPHELATHIISGLYRAMRHEETPKPVLLMAACEVLSNAIIDKGYRLDLRVKNFDEFRLADLLIHFGDEVAKDDLSV